MASSLLHVKDAPVSSERVGGGGVGLGVRGIGKRSWGSPYPQDTPRRGRAKREGCVGKRGGGGKLAIHGKRNKAEGLAQEVQMS